MQRWRDVPSPHNSPEWSCRLQTGPGLLCTVNMTLQPFVSLYQHALTPLAPFTWFGLQISSLDLVAAFRLCYVLRHLREDLRNEHVKRRATDDKLPAPEDRSFVRDALTVLTVVYGGEAIAGTPIVPIDLSSILKRPFSSPPRRPLVLHDLRCRSSAVHPCPGARRQGPFVATHGAPLGTPTVVYRRAHPCDAGLHTCPARCSP